MTSIDVTATIILDYKVPVEVRERMVWVVAYDPRRSRSVSQLNSYTSCGLAYKLERLDKAPSPPAAWTIRGTAVHETVELWEQSERTSDWESLYRNVWDVEERKAKARWPDLNTWIKTPGVKNTENDLKLREKDGLKQAEGYIARALAEAEDWEPLRLADGSLAVELKFQLDVGSDLFYLSGYIDLLQSWRKSGTITVADLKTGGDDRENYRQLGVYGLAARTCFGVDVQFGRYWYTKLDRGSDWIDLSMYTKEYLRSEYEQLDRAVEAGIFLANPKKKSCELFCGVRQHCPEMRDKK